jgi:pteridine reductase
LMGVNLKAPFFLSQACAKALASTQGVIINLTDIYAERPLPNHPVYSASKAGLVALTRSLAQELGPNVRVNAIAPGAIIWPESGDSEENQNEILRRTPLGRLGKPRDIAGTVMFLLRDAPFITGQIINVDGGRSARP